MPAGGDPGQRRAARFIVLDYRGARRSRAPLVLVGKGVTFDTGGISLKDPPAMDEMKYDMCGAATVLAAIDFAARSELKINLVGLIPTCENMPDGRAVKPGDIVTSASGPDGRDSQHRRGRPADPVRRTRLRAPLPARRGDRLRHPDRRLHHRTRSPSQWRDG